jgi:hypothetical protein
VLARRLGQVRAAYFCGRAHACTWPSAPASLRRTAQSRHFGNEALSLHRQQPAQLCARVILPLAPGASPWLPS